MATPAIGSTRRLTVLNIIDGFTRVNGSGEPQTIDDPLHREDGADEHLFYRYAQSW